MLKSFAIAAAMLAVLGTATVAQAATVAVSITNYMFEPAKIIVHPGDTVVWTNQDSIPHTATALDGKSFDSGTIDPDASWRFTFTKAGDYKYRCAIHPDMQGEVDVQ